MSLCLNPVCTNPNNDDANRYCQHCGRALRLGDRYQAVELIGQGGFGRTFLAVDQHAEPLRSCIIKQLLPRLSDAEAERHRRFQQEVTQLNQLGQHPQIPQLLDHIELENEQYLIQEWIPGQNLDQLIQQRLFDETQVRQLLAELLPVLRYVHQHQVIHRDIKPANIICHAQTQNYVLVDFGAAKAVEEQMPTGTSIGSAGYTAPEQTMGKATFASDLYSLGVTCIHLLTGLHPFDLYSVSEDAWVWRQYLPRPISLELRRVLDKLLQRATRQRYQSATEVLQALRLEAKPTAVPVAVGQTSESLSAVRPAPPPMQAADLAEIATQNWRCGQTLGGHQGAITALAISPDSRLIASGSTDQTIRLWSLKTGELLHCWEGRARFPQGHEGSVTALVFSPNSRVLISGSADGRIKQWDLRNFQLFCDLAGHGWGISALALSGQEPLLVSGSQDGLIQLWDLETETRIANLVQLHQPVTGLVVDATGQTLWSSSGKPICHWNLKNDQLLTTLKGHTDTVTAIALSRDGSTLISAGSDKLLKLWNLNTGQQQKLIAAHRDRICCLAVHPRQPWFASASEDSTIKLWDLWTGRRLASLRQTWSVNAMAFSPKGLLVSGGVDATLQIWQQC
jgi:serine/threonine protein kinase